MARNRQDACIVTRHETIKLSSELRRAGAKRSFSEDFCYTRQALFRIITPVMITKKKDRYKLLEMNNTTGRVFPLLGYGHGRFRPLPEHS